MAVKVFVLGGQKRVHYLFWDSLDRYEDASFGRIFGQQATISAVNAGRDRRLVMRELLIIRQFAIEMPNRVADDRTPNDRQEIGADEQEPKEGDPFDDVRLALCV